MRAGDGSGTARDYPVIAMDCVPGKYPAPVALNELAQYFVWSDAMEARVLPLLERVQGKPPVLGQPPPPFVAVQWRQEFASMARQSNKPNGQRPKCNGFSMMQCAPLLDSEVARGGDFPLELCSPTADSMRELLTGALGTYTHIYIITYI